MKNDLLAENAHKEQFWQPSSAKNAKANLQIL